MYRSLRAFAADRRGMIVSDWVVLTAATLVGLIVVVRLLFNDGVSAMVDNVDHANNGISMGTGPMPGADSGTPPDGTGSDSSSNCTIDLLGICI